jgi:S1-C subfamily serine protease
MKRVPVYSSSRAPDAEMPEVKKEKSFSWKLQKKKLGITGASLAVCLLAVAGWMFGPSLRGMTQAEVAAAIQRAMEANPPRPTAVEAFERIAPSIVHVRAYAEEEVLEPGKEKPAGQEKPQGQEKAPGNEGTGVVIVDTGVILTNLHVVRGAKRLTVTFADGLEAEAELTGERPEHDLAVLQAKTIPDDLMAAVMRSTSGLKPGDEVVAVGFPFGIGPSASAGVISGLRREYRSTSGERILTNLIQFDAAVNPGNSGGALVTNEGEVIGIVTGLLNPTEQRVFIGIGFAVPIENAASAAGLSPF